MMDWKTAFKNLQSKTVVSKLTFEESLYGSVPYGWKLKKNVVSECQAQVTMPPIEPKQKKPSQELRGIVRSMEAFTKENALQLTSNAKLANKPTQCLFVSKSMETEDSPGHELLEKMRQAMSLKSFSLCLSLCEAEASHTVSQAIAESRPHYVLAFGGLAVQSLWGKQRRLSAINGQFFPALLTDGDGTQHSFHIVPLFHPDYLLVNPQMKRGVWESLQEVMKSLGKKV